MNTSYSRRDFLHTSLTAAALLSATPWANGAAAGAPVMKLSGFADEISPKLDVQIRVCKELGVKFIELRAVEGKGVLDLTAPLRKEVLTRLQENGMGIACIGSPIGKVPISDPWPAHFDRFKVAVDSAEYFSAPLIRVFSFFPAKDAPFPTNREEVMRRMQAMADYAKGHPVTLVHENEKKIYGEKGAECLDILKTVNSPKLRCAFDFANFLEAGDDPQANWELLKGYVVHIHIKDYDRKTKKVVPAGQGDGHVQGILEDAGKMGYSGFLSLEPHLKVAGPSSGETGPELFKVAAEALRTVCRKAKIQLV